MKMLAMPGKEYFENGKQVLLHRNVMAVHSPKRAPASQRKSLYHYRFTIANQIPPVRP